MANDRKDELDVLMEGFWYLNRAFKVLNLEPPTEIILKSHEEGMRILQLINQKNLVYQAGGPYSTCKPIEHPNGSVWMETDMMGIKLRFPANKYATKLGYVWG